MVKPKSPKPAKSEVEAYGFIRENLREVGWIVKDPARSGGGQVWTQNQCLNHPEIKRALHLSRPENVVKVGEDRLWIIESKADRKDIAKALREAIDDYAELINGMGGACQAILASGVAGDDTSGYLVETRIRIAGAWEPVTINGKAATGFISPKDVQTLISTGGAEISDFSPPQHLFLQAAERINEILHMGGINKNDRAKTIAALLLAVIEEPTPNLDTSLLVLIGEINTRSECVLRDNGKPDFAPHVKILPPTNKDNHVKYKNALVRTIQELRNLNVRSAMNSSTDVLGQFYEVFLKYGNGAKEIGIVLTPRHITRFAVEAIGTSAKDIVLDPACGTGGFLVAALDHVRRSCAPTQFERFKEHNIFGVEQEPYVALLAIVNMIFRGDGKHNIGERNCFTTYLTERTVNGHPSAAFIPKPPKAGDEPVTRVFMNPPFALRAGDEKEYHFVRHALGLMADGGILFCLIPLGAMFRDGEEKLWRDRDLLGHHTLLAVLSLPEHLFVPAASKQVLAVIVKKGAPHPKQQPVLWARVAHDGHVVVKRKRLPASEFKPPRKEPNQLDAILPTLKAFLAAPTTTTACIPEFCKTAPIDFSDPLLELVPEAYIDSRAPQRDELREAVEELARETVSYLVRFGQGSAPAKKESEAGAQ